MKSDAISVANYFIELSKQRGQDIDLLGLIKRVYIAHGFTLALLDEPLLDYRFDRVEAWRYGPVIPSVYHTFKHHGKNAIKDLAQVARWGGIDDGLEFFTPILEDKDAKEICEMVSERYKNYTGTDLVAITHREGTPWSICYIEGENVGIPDRYTQKYYKLVIEQVQRDHERISKGES